MTETPICSSCNQNASEEGYAIALCSNCRNRLVARPFPLWIKLSIGVILIVFLFACFGIPSSFAAKLALERGLKAEHAGHYAVAIREYKKAQQRYPDSTKILARLTIANLKNDDRKAAMEIVKKIQGRKVDKATVDEINGAIYQMAPQKVRQ